MEKLRYLNDEILSLLELKEDFLFHKLTDEQVRYYINESMALGKKAAQEFMGKNIESILRKNEVSIIIDTSEKEVGMRAEIHFDEKIKEIRIYKKSLKQMSDMLKKVSIENLEKKIYEIHLAHEFYHFLEFRDDKYTNKELDEIVSFSLGPIKIKATILKTRELAAHAFCKELLGLEFHPRILDYMYLIERKEISNESLEEMVSLLKKKYLD